MRRDRAGWLGWTANLAGLLVALWVAYPVFFHAFVLRPVPPPKIVADLRSIPGGAKLRELTAHPPLGPEIPADESSVAIAERWLAAARDPAKKGQHPIVMRLDAADLDSDAGIGALAFSSLYAADVFVHAYRATGSATYLATARDLILGYVRYERSAWRDRGFLWNDHAIAARVGVIIRFWASYRSHSLFEAATAPEILQHVSRCTALLSAASHFTAWSNHGVMQNVALLQVAAAFPGLIDSDAAGRLAMDRLAMQWRHYISEEGVILEHSSDYHMMGRTLLTTAVRLAEMNGFDVPAVWREQLRKANVFETRLMRPDGTLPAFGDTHVRLPPTHDVRTPPGGNTVVELRLYPLSGYAIWTSHDGSGVVGSHTAVTWSNFPGHAHRLAQDLGLALWADGRGWITPSGYAPYGSEFRSRFEGWLGSNSPHASNERSDAVRHTELLGSSESSSLVLIDVRRRNAGGGGFRRQVVSLAGTRWLVLDQSIGEPPRSTTETLWTFYPDLEVEPRAEGRFLVRRARLPALNVAVIHPAAVNPSQTTIHRGSRDPFAGWIATEQGVLPAPSLRVRTDAAWTATLFELAPSAGEFGVDFYDGEQWKAAGTGWKLRRSGAVLESELEGQKVASHVVEPVDVRQASAAIASSLAETLRIYPKYRNLDEYRLRAAAVLAGLWLLQITIGIISRKVLARRGALNASRYCILSLWTAVGLWLNSIYFGG